MVSGCISGIRFGILLLGLVPAYFFYLFGIYKEWAPTFLSRVADPVGFDQGGSGSALIFI